MKTDPSSSLQAITDDAALWYAKLDSGSADLSEFEEWRKADPRHAAAFARIAATGELLTGLSGDVAESDALPAKRSTKSRRQFLIQSGVVVATAVAGLAVWFQFHTRAYAQTPVGGRQTIPLPGGDRIDLNTDTRVSWRYAGRKRELWLERGEIALHAEQGPEPVLIHAGGKALLISFGEVTTRLRDSSVELTVLKGESLIDSLGASIATQVPLIAGQSIVVGKGAQFKRHLTEDDVSIVTAWRSDEIYATGQSLGSVVADYNRYVTGKIVINDPEVAGLRVGGRFSTRNPKEFVSALESTFGLRATTQPDGTIRLGR